jgi:hypothetical protein
MKSWKIAKKGLSSQAVNPALQAVNPALQNEISALEPHFDAVYYAKTYADVAASGLSLIEHYCGFGWREGRNPTPWFCTNFYLETYPDIAEANMNPFLHYLQFGRHEGRASGSLDANAYNELKRDYERLQLRLYAREAGYQRSVVETARVLEQFRMVHEELADVRKSASEAERSTERLCVTYKQLLIRTLSASSASDAHQVEAKKRAFERVARFVDYVAIEAMPGGVLTIEPDLGEAAMLRALLDVCSDPRELFVMGGPPESASAVEAAAPFASDGLQASNIRFIDAHSATGQSLALVIVNTRTQASTIGALCAIEASLLKGAFVLVTNYWLDDVRTACVEYRQRNNIADEIITDGDRGIFWRKDH